MILKPEIEESELAEHLDWYSTNFEHVDKVYCGSDLGEGCGELLALEVSAPLTQDAHSIPRDSRGVVRIVVSPEMLSTRVRVDEAPDGQKMVGYICKCGNDTNLGEAELHHPPKNGWYADVMPHEYPRIRQAIKDCGHVANYKEENGVKHYESFRVERVK